MLPKVDQNIDVVNLSTVERNVIPVLVSHKLLHKIL